VIYHYFYILVIARLVLVRFIILNPTVLAEDSLNLALY